MKQQHVRMFCLLAWVGLLLMNVQASPTALANVEPPACEAAATVVVQQHATLRAGPGTQYAISGTAAPNSTLNVVTFGQDEHECWYQVQQDGMLAWIAGGTVAPLASPTDAPTLEPHLVAPPSPVDAAPSLVEQPAGDASTGGAPGAPSSFIGTDVLVPPTPPAGSQQRRVTVRVCLDTNANQFCDVGDGIGGMPVFVLDSVTGAVLAWGRTDTDGLIQLVVRAAPNAPVVVNIPYLGTFDTVGQAGQAVTRTVPFTPALPGLIP